jgi:translocator protein
VRFNSLLKLLLAISISEAAGIIGSIFTASALPTWYAQLIKPDLNPPGWMFGPVWTTLYALMGVAAFLVWTKSWERRDVRKALSVFGFQLVLNASWSIVFFGLQSPGWALVNIALMWLAILWTMILFYKISKPATWLLVPYILWVSFAAYLNYSIYVLN